MPTDPSRRAICNHAYGGFGTGQDRLNRSLDAVGFTGGRVFFKDYLPGCPTHEEQPYAFKLFVIREAIRQGFTSIVWVDARVWALKPLDPFFEILERDGIYLMTGGARMDAHSSDESLVRSGLTRDQAAEVPMLGGSLYGLDLTNPKTKAFFDEWWAWYEAGLFKSFTINTINREKMYAGGYRGRSEGFVSADPRVLGHSHDEACASFIAHRMGLPIHKVGEHYNGYHPEWAALPNSYFAARGM